MPLLTAYAYDRMPVPEAREGGYEECCPDVQASDKVWTMDTVHWTAFTVQKMRLIRSKVELGYSQGASDSWYFQQSVS